MMKEEKEEFQNCTNLSRKNILQFHPWVRIIRKVPDTKGRKIRQIKIVKPLDFMIRGLIRPTGRSKVRAPNKNLDVKTNSF